MPKSNKTRKSSRPLQLRRRALEYARDWWHLNAWNRILAIILAILILFVGGMYVFAQWYMFTNRKEPVTIGATFIPAYARYYDLDPEQTMRAMIDELGLKRLRLVSYWKVGEPEQGVYDFSEFDWQMKMAEEKGVQVSLALGLRQPRWPECHMPTWAEGMTMDEWSPKLHDYIEAVVNRYKDSPALESYQLENEYFLKVFGECPDFTRERLVSEYELVKQLDPDTPVVISMSNNAIGMPLYEPTPDKWAISIYKRVWDKTLTKRYFEYPIPAWYYGFRAGFTELTRGRPVFAHELQAEPWPPDSLGTVKDVSLEEQDKSMNADRLRHRFEYGRSTGMKTIDMWGAEWWYWRKVAHGDSSLWDVAREEIARTEAQNAAR
jgi:hypothetical protein